MDESVIRISQYQTTGRRDSIPHLLKRKLYPQKKTQMKTKLLLIILLTSAICSRGQSDSTLHRLNALEQTVSHVQYNLVKAHDQFQLGFTVFALGTFASTAGILIPEETSLGQSNKGTKNAMLIAGGIGSLVGVFLMVDAHKYFGRAGRWTFDGTKLTVTL